jgi:DNA-binding Lrp family transcriptional regulator
LAQLTAAGVIKGRTPVIDLTSLGFVEYSMFMRTEPSSRPNLPKFLALLVKQKGVSWIGKLLGEFDLCASIVTNDPLSLSATVDAAASASVVQIAEKRLVFREKSFLYPRQHLAPEIKLPPGPVCGGPKERRKPLDEPEIGILRTLSRKGFVSDREIERQTKIPQATVSRKLRQLEEEEEGIIAGYIYRYNLNLGGQLGYFVFLSLDSRKILPKFERYVANHGHACQFRQVYGCWDAEIQFESDITAAGATDCDDLYSAFGQHIVNVTTA